MSSPYQRRVAGDRLQYFGATADPAFWSRQWTVERATRYYSGAMQGRLGLFEEIFSRHLPREGRILEAGCGLGHLVVALRARGYDCEGVEWAEATVAIARAHFPDLPIRVGDVTRLDEADGTYDAIVSLGVVEHRQEGPEPFLEEFARVLSPGGVLLLSVPFFSPLRRLKARLGAYRADVRGLPYYQQAFTPADLQECVQRNGFEVRETIGYDPVLGLSSEVPGTARIVRLPPLGHRLRRALNRSVPARNLLAHMVMLVCRKAGER